MKKYEVLNMSLKDHPMVHGQPIPEDNAFMLLLVVNDDQTDWRELEVGDVTHGSALGSGTSHAVEIKRVS